MIKRRKKSHILLWIVVAISVIAMAGFGVNSAMQSTPSSPVIRVGESEISQEEYFSALQGRLSEISQQQGQPFSMDEARLVGIPQQVRARLINQATLAEIARRNDLIASDQAVGEALVAIPAFQDSSGNFSRQQLDIFLNNRGLSEDEFLSQIRNDLERGMVLDILAGEPIKIDHLTGLIVDDFGERRVVSFVSLAEVAPVNNADVPAPTEAEMRAHYDEDPSRYLDIPKRSFELAYILPDEAAVSDEDVNDFYEKNQAEFGTPATVNYQVLAFPNAEAAQAFYANPDFSGVAQERGLEAGDYQFEDKAVTALPEDLQNLIAENGTGLYEPQETLLGWNVYKVTTLNEADVAPLEQLRGEIVKRIASDQLNERLTSQYESLAELTDSRARPEAIAQESDLQFIAWQMGDAPIAGLTDSAEFEEWFNTADEGDVSDLVKLADGGVFVAYLNANPPAEPKSFEDAQAQISDELLLAAKRELQLQTAQSMLNSGNSLEVLAENGDFEIQQSEAVTSQQAHNVLPLAISFEAFNKPTGEVWMASDENGYYLARVDDVLEVDLETAQGQSIAQSVGAQVDGSTTEGVVLDFLNASAQEYGAVQYDALIDQVEAQIR